MKAERIWADVAQQCARIGVDERDVHKTRTRLAGQQQEGHLLTYLDDGLAEETAARMLQLRVEREYLQDRLERISAREELVQQEFWLAVTEQLGVDSNRQMAFDADSGAVYLGGNTDAEESRSYFKTLKGYRNLLEQALESPLVAHRMANDHQLPTWLQTTAEVLVSRGLKPAIRSALEKGVNDPEYARLMFQAGENSGWPSWLVDALEMLGDCVEST